MHAEGDGDEPTPTDQECEPDSSVEFDIDQLIATPPTDPGPSTSPQAGFPSVDFTGIE